MAFASASRSTTLYQTTRWKKESAAFLIGKRCVDCGATANLTTDHEPAHRGNEAAFWDKRTWVPRCRPCHNKKTGRETQARRPSRRRPAEIHPGLLR
jgi:5-methylcytosine-specific restriction protein A